MSEEARIAFEDATAELVEALKPFADYADPTGKLPDSFTITSGSSMARKQLTMGDCYRALRALKRYAA